MTAARVWEIIGGLAAVLSILAAMARVSYQLGDFRAELSAWRAATDGRLDALEDGNYVPRHRGRSGPG